MNADLRCKPHAPCRFLRLPAGMTFDRLMGFKKGKKEAQQNIGPKSKFIGQHSDGSPLSVTFQVRLLLRRMLLLRFRYDMLQFLVSTFN